MGGGVVKENVFDRTIEKRAVQMLAPVGARFHGNWLLAPGYVYAAPTRNEADLRDNALLAGVVNLPYDQEIQHLQNNWWGRPLPAQPSGCYDYKATYVPAVEHEAAALGTACYGPPSYSQITRYFTNLIPALDSPPPWPVAGVTPVAQRDVSQPEYVEPAALRVEQAFGVSCDGGRGADNTEMAGDPVNTATGSLTETFTDLSVKGPGRMTVWSRSYNSLDALTGPLGRGWTFGHNASLTRSEEGLLTFRDPTGGQSRFRPAAGGGYSPADAGVTATLKDRSDGGWIVRSQACNDFVFDADRRFVQERDSEGRVVRLSYDSQGRLDSLSDEADQKITVMWGTSGAAEGRITGVTSADGRSVRYGYEMAVGEARLTSVIGVDGAVSRYRYDDATGLLSGITDPRGETSAINTYDPATKRVVRQVDAAGAVMTFVYDDATQTTTVTDAAGRTRKDVYSGRNLVRQVDGEGNVTEVRYGANNAKAAVEDGLKRRELLWRDDRGNVVKRVSPAPVSAVEEWTYDAANRVTSYRNPRGHVTRYGYDVSGRVMTVTHADGAGTSYTYTARGQVATVTRPGNRVTRLGYNAVGDITSITFPSGATTTMTYDAGHRLVSPTDPRGNVDGADAAAFTTTWGYDDAGRVTSVRDPLGRVTRYGYDLAGNRTSVTNRAGKVTRYTYNARNQVESETDPLGRVTRYGYDPTGLLTSVTRPGGARTTYGYDGNGQLAWETAPSGNLTGIDAETRRRHTTRYDYDPAGQLVRTRRVDPADPSRDLVTGSSYDAHGRITAVTDAAGRTTAMEYDAAGNVTATVGPDGARTSTDYDALGRAVSVIDPEGGVTAYDYDSAGNLRKLTAPGNRISTFAYDADGRLRTAVDPRGNVAGAEPARFATELAYDLAGNLTAVTDPLGRATRTTWDAANQRRSVRDPQGRVTSWQYDDTGALASVKAPTGAVTSYTYDDGGQLSARVEPGERTSAFTYRPDGLLETETTAAGRLTRYDYDANGNRTIVVRPSGTSTDAAGDGTIETSFDWLGRVTKVDYSDAAPDLTFTNDPAGLVTAGTQALPDGAVTTSYGYGPSGRVKSINRGAERATYAYNKGGQLVSRAYADGRSFTYRYQNGLPSSLTAVGASGASSTTNYRWDPAGQLAEVARPGGVVSSYTHDTAAQLTRLTHSKGTTSLVDYAVTYNDSGEPASVTTTRAGTTSSAVYEHTADGLVTVCRPVSRTTCSSTSPSIRYGYDALGRRVSETGSNTPDSRTLSYVYDSADQLTAVKNAAGEMVESATWDVDGRQTGRRASGKTRTYTYGLDENLAAVTLEDGRRVAYTYDADGNRLTRAVNGTRDRTWVWDRLSAELGMRVGELDGAGKALHAWVPDPVSGLATAMGDTVGAAPTWLLPDSVGNITDTATAGSGLTGEAKLNPFGDQAVAPTGAAATNPLRFHGQYLDELTGLYDVRARDYDPVRAMFTAVDPVSPQPVDPYLTTYHYGPNTPLTLADPTGRLPDWLEEIRREAPGTWNGTGDAVSDTWAALDQTIDVDQTGITIHGDRVVAQTRAAWRNGYERDGGWGALGEVTGVNEILGNWVCAQRLDGKDDYGSGYHEGRLIPSILAAAIPGGSVAKRLGGRTGGAAEGASSRLVPGGGLTAHEAAGGHALARHLGQSDADLLARIAANPGISGASTFGSRATAEASVADVLGAGGSQIQSWLAGTGGKLVLNGRGTDVVGRYVAQGSSSVVDAYGTRVVLVRDSSLGVGYRIQTAFPTP